MSEPQGATPWSHGRFARGETLVRVAGWDAGVPMPGPTARVGAVLRLAVEDLPVAANCLEAQTAVGLHGDRQTHSLE
jgi:hypothetical protein